MKSIAERWLDFDRRVIAQDAPQIQHDEMRIAFYAGCAVMIDVGNEVADITSDALGVLILETIYREVWKFGRQYEATGGQDNA